MGIVNDMIFVRKNTQEFEGPFLEVGSKNYGNTQPIREFFPATALYRGVDIESGPGVDVVLDLGGKIDQIDNTLGTLRFGTIFCLNMLEHCENPFQVADNLMSLLKPGGKICISVPFACA